MRGPGGPSRASSGVPIRTPGAVTAGRRTVLPSQERRRVPGPKTVECHAAGFALTWRGRPPGRVRSKPIKHRARDALGLADLRHALPFRSNQSGRRGTQDFDKPRCREASRPAGPIGPWRPARPRLGAGGKRAKKTGLPGASIKNTGDGACAVRCRTKQSRV